MRVSIIGPELYLKNVHKSKDIEGFKLVLSLELINKIFMNNMPIITQNDRINIHPKNISVTLVDLL